MPNPEECQRSLTTVLNWLNETSAEDEDREVDMVRANFDFSTNITEYNKNKVRLILGFLLSFGYELWINLTNLLGLFFYICNIDISICKCIYSGWLVNEHNPFQDYVRYPNCSLTDHRFTIDFMWNQLIRSGDP